MTFLQVHAGLQVHSLVVTRTRAGPASIDVAYYIDGRHRLKVQAPLHLPNLP